MSSHRDSASGSAQGARVGSAKPMLRIFVAVFPPPEVQRAAYTMSEALRGSDGRVSWVKPDNLHYTMRFIGDVGQDGARRIAEAATEAAASHAAFEAVLGDLGAFPDPRRARVIWLGLASGGNALEALARDLDAALARRGFGRAEHAFTAHLTLGRVRDPGPDWSEWLAAVPTPDPRPRFRVDRLGVIESRLSPKGSTYTIRAEGRLRDG